MKHEKLLIIALIPTYFIGDTVTTMFIFTIPTLGEMNPFVRTLEDFAFVLFPLYKICVFGAITGFVWLMDRIPVPNSNYMSIFILYNLNVISAYIVIHNTKMIALHA